MQPEREPLSIERLREAMGAESTWLAEETDHWQLTPDQKRLRLGAVPPNTTMTAREQMAAARNLAAAGPAMSPGAWDWRNVGGQNYVTAIKDQGNCGSCVAFGSIATVEVTARVEYGSGLPINLSEGQLYYCIAESKYGATCNSGWWPDQAFAAFEHPGITDQSYFPYTAGDQGCSLASGWQDQVAKLIAWHTLGNSNDMKAWLSTRGALSACFSVYEDFYAYSSGVYRHTSGNFVGGHCVSIVGYDDTQQCWICKNSWGTGFGESGFFRIGYGECGIEAETWAADGVVVRQQTTVPLYRYWNGAISDHFYTTNWAELGTGRYGWNFEETECYVYPGQQPGSVPLYRYWNGSAGDHFYTTNWAELGGGSKGYAYEGIQCYVYPGSGRDDTGLYRYYSAGGTDHFYTVNFDELGNGAHGWVLENVQCFTPAGPGAAPTARRADTVPESFRAGSTVAEIVPGAASFTVRRAEEEAPLLPAPAAAPAMETRAPAEAGG